jgi:hypothetical protein
MLGDERFLAEGAQCSCGSLILKNKEVGFYRGDAFTLTHFGQKCLAELEAVTDVATKPVKPKKIRLVESVELAGFAA